MDQINLEEVLSGFPGISHFKAGMLYECCILTLHKQHHASGVNISVTGDAGHSARLCWSSGVTTQMESSYADQPEATEYAAECLAVLFTVKMTGLHIVERSVKGTGIDYWLGNPGDVLFQKKARLEISGIFEGDEKTVEQRWQKKSVQVRQSTVTGLPVIICITCFKQPLTKFTYYAS